LVQERRDLRLQAVDVESVPTWEQVELRMHTKKIEVRVRNSFETQKMVRASNPKQNTWRENNPSAQLSQRAEPDMPYARCFMLCNSLSKPAALQDKQHDNMHTDQKTNMQHSSLVRAPFRQLLHFRLQGLYPVAVG